ncbi:MAG: 16S rRNA (uracil(1498)-N(3))-methyltransferase [Gammaproteobacteria bacterium]
MRISRLYIREPLVTGQDLTLDEDSAHYVRTVLRLKKDAELVLFDGSGAEYAATVLEASRKRVAVHLDRRNARSAESPLFISLGLAVSRGDRMDFAVQKAVELGVNALTPLVTERCVVHLKGDKEQSRHAHWSRIVQHAAEQCGRTLLPDLHPITELSDWLDSASGLKIFLDPYAQCSLADLYRQGQPVSLLSGPEGGFADHEREWAMAAGFTPVRLGRRILRAETASLAALAAVQMLWGDFGKSD